VEASCKWPRFSPAGNYFKFKMAAEKITKESPAPQHQIISPQHRQFLKKWLNHQIKHVFRLGLMSRSLSESDLSELDGMEIAHDAEKSQETLPSSGRREHLPAR
jgi:hypothetical protein